MQQGHATQGARHSDGTARQGRCGPKIQGFDFVAAMVVVQTDTAAAQTNGHRIGHGHGEIGRRCRISGRPAGRQCISGRQSRARFLANRGADKALDGADLADLGRCPAAGRQS